MSGSGGGGYGGDVGGEPTSCETLIFRTTLSSPKPRVVASISKDDVLQVVKEGTGGPVVCQTDDGKTAGSITAGQLLRLVRCIDDGYSYIAIVKSVEKGRVDVEVRPGPTR